MTSSIIASVSALSPMLASRSNMKGPGLVKPSLKGRDGRQSGVILANFITGQIKPSVTNDMRYYIACSSGGARSGIWLSSGDVSSAHTSKD